MNQTALENETFASSTGAQLQLYSAVPIGDIQLVIVISHGLSEHAARYAPFMLALAEAGIAAYAHDHRGHGKTTAPDAAPRTFAQEGGARKVLDDLASVRAEAAARHSGKPIIVFGHSMGGLIALNHAMDHPDDLAGLVVANSDFRAGPLVAAARALLAWERFRKGSDAEATIMKRLTFDAWNRQVGESRTEADWLSRDHAQVDAVIADPDCGWLPTVSMWRDLFRFVEGGADDERLKRLPANLPVLLIGGGQDPATRRATATRELYARMEKRGMTDVTLRIDENHRHETLNEIDRKAVMAELIEWFRAVSTERKTNR